MRLRAGCELQITATPNAPFVSILQPQSGWAQNVWEEKFIVSPSAKGREFIDGFGNRCRRLLAPAESFTIRAEVLAEVSDQILVDESAPYTEPEFLPDETLQYLLPSRYCPSDKLLDQAQEIVTGIEPGYQQAQAFTNYIRNNITYKYGVSDGSTSALDTLRQGAGVCRDYAHIGISFCRAMQIPARMVAGYLYGLDPMDQHAWFEAYFDGTWYTFDATQDQPRGGRIVIAYGRDAADVALITELGQLKTDHMDVWVEPAE